MNFSAKLLLSLLAVTVGLAMGLVVQVIRARRNARNVPDADTLEKTLTQVQEWKREGLRYRECFDRLAARGFRKDVADAILGQAERGGSAMERERKLSPDP